jgi:chlorite dismutase
VSVIFGIGKGKRLEMPEQIPRWLNHFSFFSFTQPYYTLSSADQKQNLAAWLSDLHQTSPCVELYQVYPAQPDVDILVWCSMEAGEVEVPGRFFTQFAAATNPYRHLILPKNILWGFTQPSQYTKTRSTQEIDPLDSPRAPFLIIYPFVKTVSWYLMGREARQGMMNEHIRIGKQYPEIKQLLLYSFGLQDQEFIVAYETADLIQFSNLVYELRSSEARRYTERDTPIFTAIYHTAEETLNLWA